jgi:hypothetical protein
MPRTVISERIMNIISFLCGIIFANGVVALLANEYLMAILMFIVVVLALLMKKFVDWDIE